MGRIIRLADARDRKRSGRFSAAQVYSSGRRTRQERSGRFSTRAVYDGTAPQRAREVEETAPEIERVGGAILAEDYAIRLGPGAIARVRLTRESAGRARIDWVFVPPSARGTGTASRIMRAVVQDADAAGVALVLEARACAGLDQAALEGWYGRFGFAATGLRETFGPLLRREPARLRRAA